jgi:lipopolysaccharide export system protein LptA
MVRLLLCLLLLSSPHAQMAQTKTKKWINIDHADLWVSDPSVVKNAQRLLGDVLLSHNNIIMKCDSAWSYSNSNMVDAFGKVHIISNDTLNLWARFINYNGDTELAKARRNVVLTDPSLTLTTDSLDFDMKEEIGYYNYGGKIVDSTNTLTSDIGRYYTRLNELFFTGNVMLKNDDYTITSDSMLYNTETKIVTFNGPTHIVGDSTYVYGTNGWFNTITNETELNKNSTIKRKNTQLQANYIFYNDNTGDGFANGSVIIEDFDNNMVVMGNKAVYSDFEQYALVTDSAIWMQYYEGDTLFLHADTLYTMPDTSGTDAKMLIAYNNSRFFRTDIQGICDSLIYLTKDSTIQMYNDPVLWSNENQMTASYIEFFNRSLPPNEVHLKNNSFIIQEVDSTKFNQIKGKNMVGYTNRENLYRIDVNGNGQSIYYPSDQDDYIGINKAESSNIILYLSENRINRITFVGSPSGVMNPLTEVVPADTKLEGYNWRIAERPNSKYEIFGPIATTVPVAELPSGEILITLPDIEQSKKELDELWDNTDLKKQQENQTDEIPSSNDDNLMDSEKTENE